MLIDMISVSFRCSGGLLRNLHVLGLRCPEKILSSHQGNIRSSCKVCQRACQSFPLDQVLNFENRVSSGWNCGRYMSSRRSFDLDVCLPRSQVESIIEARPGGSALLRSDARFLHLLGRGIRNEIRSGDSEPYYLLTYSVGDLGEIRRFVDYAQLDVSRMAREDVTAAILRSLAIRGPMPPKDRCFFSRFAFNSLKKTGLPIVEEDFGFEASNVKNLPQIIHGVMNGDDIIQYECCLLLCRLLRTSSCKLSSHQAIDSGLVTHLIRMSTERLPGQQRVAICLLESIVKKGTIEETKAFVELVPIPKLIRMIRSEDKYVAQLAALCLGTNCCEVHSLA